jgi:hypothetical protein
MVIGAVLIGLAVRNSVLKTMRSEDIHGTRRVPTPWIAPVAIMIVRARIQRAVLASQIRNLSKRLRKWN